MRHWRTALLAGGIVLAGLSGPGQAQPDRGATRSVDRVFFDTDIGPDVDDVGAATVLHALADRGVIELIGMACCTSNEFGSACLDALNTYFGRPDLPVGTFPGSGFLVESKYAGAVAQRFPNDLKSGKHAPPAVEVYRRVLFAQPDGSVIVVATGPLNNLRDLLRSGPDRHSALSGLELVRRKVRLLSVMGGRFPAGKEWNFEQSPESAALVAETWPTPVIYSGFEIGAAVKTGGRLNTSAPEDSPVRAAYALYSGPGKDRESWDQTAVVAGTLGVERHWTASGPGRAIVNPRTGENSWATDARGNQHYLVQRDPIEQVKTAIENLMLHQPSKR